MRTKDGAIRENPVKTDGYQMPANAVILQAVQDYRKARQVLKKYPDHTDAEKMMRETERFFRSKWFQILSDVNPDYLIKKLKEEDAE